ncbi:MAG: hypothetical protein A2941_00350 [Candidatus Yanofskybacteria bacterium RIFCSPLOWO2_01_FULL_49_17]|uniref:Uncharacterized protein n=1 Tax=Candidatus Yanofskybacteria bacterium RIFCSPLOWO2_01_FULL_49_17 TaxID=1802700 RepID=A0A1F8GPF1_9BACT|nr:MAG: hypothetical protein A2941_00350 [Candidatus Yanofskybacteria bacterium RIFCSPLOWO2_01_FULL_49_17]
MISDFIRSCIIAPETQQEFHDLLKEMGETNTEAKKTIVSAKKTLDKVGPETRTILVAAGFGLAVAGAMLGVAISEKK